MRSKRRKAHIHTIYRLAAYMAIVGTIAGALTYVSMSGAIEALQPEMPHSWTITIAIIIEMFGCFGLGWFFKGERDREVRDAQRQEVSTPCTTYWAGRRNKGRTPRLTPHERRDAA